MSQLQFRPHYQPTSGPWRASVSNVRLILGTMFMAQNRAVQLVTPRLYMAHEGSFVALQALTQLPVSAAAGVSRLFSSYGFHFMLLPYGAAWHSLWCLHTW